MAEYGFSQIPSMPHPQYRSPSNLHENSQRKICSIHLPILMFVDFLNSVHYKLDPKTTKVKENIPLASMLLRPGPI